MKKLTRYGPGHITVWRNGYLPRKKKMLHSIRHKHSVMGRNQLRFAKPGIATNS